MGIIGKLGENRGLCFPNGEIEFPDREINFPHITEKLGKMRENCFTKIPIWGMNVGNEW